MKCTTNVMNEHYIELFIQNTKMSVLFFAVGWLFFLNELLIVCVFVACNIMTDCVLSQC